MSRRVIAMAFALAGRPALANQPPPDFEESELLEHWSFSPLVSAAYGATSRENAPDDTAGLFSLELRVRWGRARAGNDLHDEDTPKLFAIAAGATSQSFDTPSPYGTIGFHYLPTDCDCWSRRIWADIKLDAGAGYSLSDDRWFFHGKLGFGALFSEQIRYEDTRYERHRTRFRGEVDFIIIADVAANGYRLGFGIEFDPFHAIGDAAHYARF